MKVLELFEINNKSSWTYSSKEKDIKDFIKENNLQEYLKTANKKIKDYFGDKKQYLSVHYDPEIPNYEMLWIDIDCTDLTVKKARGIFKKFKWDWLLDNINENVGMHVT